MSRITGSCGVLTGSRPADKALLPLHDDRVLDSQWTHEDELEYLHRIQRAASARLEPEPVIQAVLSQIFQILQPDLAVLFLLEDDTLVLKESLPHLAEEFFQENASPRVGQCLCGLAVKQQVPVFSTDIFADTRCSRNGCRYAGYRSFAVLPLLQDNKILGCIGIASKRPRDFSANRRFLESAVGDIATGLNNALTYSRLQGFVADIDAQLEERRRSEKALLQRRKQEAVAHLAGGIAHDFNNILAAIMGFSELVLKKEIDSEARGYIEEVLKAGHRAKELVQQILTFSQKKDASLMPMNLRTLLNESLHPLRSSLPDNVTLSAYLDELPGANIRGNPAQLQQVFSNLSANSLQAMKTSGGNLKVTLRALPADHLLCARCPDLEEGRNYAELSILDTGTGIPAEHLDSIFEPYFSTRVPQRGTGLGLAVVHGIIRRHGGGILVESIPGISTTFSVYLPLYTHPSAGRCSDGAAIRRQQPPHILIVDDDESILHVMRMTLERNGYTVTTSQFAKEAMTLFSSSPETFDLVLCDLSMPDIGGEMLARQMKNLRHEIPIILCSGHSAELLRGLDTSHIDKILEKPVPRADLLRCLKETLGEG